MGNGMMTQQERDYFEALARDRAESARVLEKPSLEKVQDRVVDTYSDEAHFVYELLQNADDTGATRVRFELREEGLVFAHDGPRDFSVSDPASEGADRRAGRLGDINAIVSVGASSKAADGVGGSPAIGKFGIGFKAVFQYTRTPHIYSPTWRFRIERFIVPVLLEGDFPGREAGETLFFFPFDKPECPRERAYREIREKLRGLARPLLFLSHLGRIDVAIGAARVAYGKEVAQSLHFPVEGEQMVRVDLVRLTRRVDGAERRESLWRFSRKTEMGLDYSVGFFLDGQGRLRAEANVPAFCYFQTQVHTGLSFIVHAPFLLTNNREGIPVVEHNRRQIENLAKLAADALPCLRDIGVKARRRLIDDGLLNVIPVDPGVFAAEGDSHRLSFRPFYEAIRERMRTSSLLPTRDGEYVFGWQAYWGANETLTKLFDDRALAELKGEPEARWVFVGVERDGVQRTNKPLCAYLDGLVAGSPSGEALIREIQEDFITSRRIDWLCDFYAWLGENKDRAELARTRPLFLSEQKQAVPAFDAKGKHCLFLRTKEIAVGFTFLDERLAKEPRVAPLLRQLGIAAPTREDYIYEIVLPAYKRGKGLTAKQVCNNIGIFFDYFRGCDAKAADRLIRELMEFPILSCVRVDKPGTIGLTRPDNIYFPSEALRAFFVAKPKAYFLYEADYAPYLQDANLGPLFRNFLTRLGVHEAVCVRRQSQAPTQGDRTLYNLPGTLISTSVAWVDGCVDLVAGICRSEDAEQATAWSRCLWRTLLDLIKREGFADAAAMEQALGTEVFYRYYGEKSKRYEGFTVKMLRKREWLLDRDGDFVAPGELASADDLDVGYEVFSAEARVLLGLLGIALPEESGLSEESRASLDLGKLAQSLNLRDEADLRLAARLLEEERRRQAQKAEPPVAADPVPAVAVPAVPDLPRATAKAVNDVVARLAQSKAKSESESTSEVSEPVAQEADQDDLTPCAVNYDQRILEAERKASREIEQLTRMQELQEQAKTLPAFSCAWYRALLGMEIEEQNKQSAGSRELSLTFAQVAWAPGTERTLLLSQPNDRIPGHIEELSDLRVDLYDLEGGMTSITVDVVSVKNFTLRAKLADKSSLKLDPGRIKEAVIKVKSPAFLLEALRMAFEDLKLSDDFNLRDNLPDADRIEFVFGPPGTGKTTVLARDRLVPAMEHPCRVLVLAPTNKAADVLTRRVMACDPEGHKAWLTRFGATGDKVIEGSDIFQTRALHLGDRAVVVTTIARFPYDFFVDSGTGARHDLRTTPWDLIVVDEASMIPLYAILHLLHGARGNPHFIIAGDPNQIEPTAAIEQWKDQNAFTLVGLTDFANPTTSPKNYPIERLFTQYRSLPAIGTLFSKFAYGGCLQHARTAEDRRPLALGRFDWLRALNVVKFPVSRYESIFRPKRLGGGSCYHVYSALFAFEAIRALAEDVSAANPGLSPEAPCRIGLISPYRIQADLVKKLVERLPRRPGVEVQVGTVHGFQGDECDILLALFNPPPSISASKQMFLNKRNIVNVSISRARDALVLLIPDDDTENVGLLERIEELKLYINQTDPADVARRSADELERVLFGETGYIERNTFVTGHQSVNVYEQPEYRYEVRSEASAIDIQVRP